MKRKTALRKIRKAFRMKETAEIVVEPKYYRYALETMNKEITGKKYLIRSTEYNDYIENQIYDYESQFDDFACCKTIWI